MQSIFLQFSDNVSIDEQTLANLSLTCWTSISSVPHHADDQVGNLWEYCINVSQSCYNVSNLLNKTNTSLYNVSILLNTTIVT